MQACSKPCCRQSWTSLVFVQMVRASIRLVMVMWRDKGMHMGQHTGVDNSTVPRIYQAALFKLKGTDATQGAQMGLNGASMAAGHFLHSLMEAFGTLYVARHRHIFGCAHNNNNITQFVQASRTAWHDQLHLHHCRVHHQAGLSTALQGRCAVCNGLRRAWQAAGCRQLRPKFATWQGRRPARHACAVRRSRQPD